MQAQPNKANILDLCSKDIFIVKGFNTPGDFKILNGSKFETEVKLIKPINVCTGGLVCEGDSEEYFNKNKIPNSDNNFPFDHNGLS